MNLLFHLMGFLHREDLVELAPDDQNLLPQVEIDSLYDDVLYLTSWFGQAVPEAEERAGSLPRW